jgi:hypothetical protein
MDIYIPQEEGVEPKELVDRLDEAEGRMKTLLLDTSNCGRGLRGSEDVQATAEVVIKKFNLLKSRHKLHQSVG